VRHRVGPRILAERHLVAERVIADQVAVVARALDHAAARAIGEVLAEHEEVRGDAAIGEHVQDPGRDVRIRTVVE